MSPHDETDDILDAQRWGRVARAGYTPDASIDTILAELRLRWLRRRETRIRFAAPAAPQTAPVPDGATTCEAIADTRRRGEGRSE